VIDHTTTRFEDVMDLVDLVFDTAGGDRLRRSPAVVRRGGRLVSIAEEPAPGSDATGIDAVYFVVEPNREQLVELALMADRGDLRVTIAHVFPLADARVAFERTLTTHGPGKIVLRVREEQADA
jgi:NADPH:quinone reductase-like Zn-dependent oxidoreductase